jgi:hypothetical protein
MDERPVRLKISDDLKRGHGSVFFRIWFALPFLLWLGLWAIAAFFVALANWALTLLMGTSPSPFHRFFERFVRYATHVYAYLNLGAEPLPRFDGEPGYPIDVEFDGLRPQNRWTVAFRIVLAVPAMLLVTVLAGSGSNVYSYSSAQLGFSSFGLMASAAFLGWFVGVAQGRMPRGLRDVVAYGLSYGAQAWAYLLLLTDRYPSSDPLTAIGPPPVRDDPIQLEARDELRRSRLTVFFRLVLAFPHLVWLTLWGVAALLAAIANWVATLIAGTSPAPLHRFLAAYVRYQLHVGAFLYLVGNPFPGFTGDEQSYPIELRVAERARQGRWSVLFRLLLGVPALIVAGAYGALLLVVAVLGWFAGLFTGRMPLGLRNAGALALRYTAQTYGYLFLVTGSYPYSGPCVAPPRAPLVPEATASPPPLA